MVLPLLTGLLIITMHSFSLDAILTLAVILYLFFLLFLFISLCLSLCSLFEFVLFIYMLFYFFYEDLPTTPSFILFFIHTLHQLKFFHDVLFLFLSTFLSYQSFFVKNKDNWQNLLFYLLLALNLIFKSNAVMDCLRFFSLILLKFKNLPA